MNARKVSERKESDDSVCLIFDAFKVYLETFITDNFYTIGSEANSNQLTRNIEKQSAQSKASNVFKQSRPSIKTSQHHPEVCKTAFQATNISQK